MDDNLGRRPKEIPSVDVGPTWKQGQKLINKKTGEVFRLKNQSGRGALDWPCFYHEHFDVITGKWKYNGWGLFPATEYEPWPRVGDIEEQPKPATERSRTMQNDELHKEIARLSHVPHIVLQDVLLRMLVRIEALEAFIGEQNLPRTGK